MARRGSRLETPNTGRYPVHIEKDVEHRWFPEENDLLLWWVFHIHVRLQEGNMYQMIEKYACRGEGCGAHVEM